MTYKADVFRVFIASPSDVKERDLIREILAEWNANRASEKRPLVFQPVGWETHTFPDLRFPGQYQIDQKLVDKSDLCIALFWMKIGGSLHGGASGTVHEIERFRSAGKRVMTYFCKRRMSQTDVRAYRDDIESLDEFRRALQGIGRIDGYDTRGELKNKLLSALDDVADEQLP
ncbi:MULTISPECIES: hypothetical protein [Streptomyces]|uniref:hypothetical protein n=1 Tax=Streptomyces TaxID=1883 RepID=UPI000CF29B19|nr:MULTISPECIES: hypothetical protein [Streptomyces]PPS74506.1 hypothetical protein BV882_12800 [Streptomyces sp. 46]